MSKFVAAFKRLIHRGKLDLAAEVKVAIADAKKATLAEIENESPEIKVAVQAAVDELEKAAIAAIVSALA